LGILIHQLEQSDSDIAVHWRYTIADKMYDKHSFVKISRY